MIITDPTWSYGKSTIVQSKSYISSALWSYGLSVLVHLYYVLDSFLVPVIVKSRDSRQLAIVTSMPLKESDLIKADDPNEPEINDVLGNITPRIVKGENI